MMSPNLLFCTLCLLILPGWCMKGIGGDSPNRADGRDWPNFLGPQGNGKAEGQGIRIDWGDEGPPIQWSMTVGEGYAMPAVVGKRLFHFDRVGNQARLTCLHAETGNMLWRKTYPTDYEDHYGFSNGPRSSPSVDGEHVYIFGVEGSLRCYRTDDGALVWQVDTARRYGVLKNFFGVGTSPVLEGDLLIVMIGGSPEGSPNIFSGQVQGNGSGIVAFDKRTGKEMYRLSNELASYTTITMADIGGRRWGFAFARGGLVAFNPRQGRVDFHFPWRGKRIESVNGANPIVVGDTVFISEAYGKGSALLEVSSSGYEVRWQDPPRRGQSLAAHWSTPIYHEGYLYGLSGMAGKPDLRCIEYQTGKVMWFEPGFPNATVLFVNDHLIVQESEGPLSIVKATPKGFERGSRWLPKSPEAKPWLTKPAFNAPILARGLLYAKGGKHLVCLNLTAGSTNERRP